MREDNCNGKQCYSHGEAERVRKARRKGTGKRLRIYKCDKCFFFHLTHEEKHDKKPMREFW